MKRIALSLITGVLSAGCLATGSASAGEGDLVTRLMGKPLGSEKSYACFQRVYDGAHMAAHPQQVTRSMKVLVTMEQDPESKQPVFVFMANLTKRGSAQTWETSGSCGVGRGGDDEGPVVKLGCGIDCDGGGVDIAMGRDDKSIRLSLERARIMPVGQDDPEFASSLSGPDDRLFRLDRVVGAECATLPADKKDRAALRAMK